MNSRQRYLAVIKGEAADRIPLVDWGIREATVQEWRRQGLTCSMEDYVGLEPYGIGVPIRFGHLPAFEEAVLEDRGDHKLWIDSEGATRVDFKELATPGFVTRKWIRFPVETRADFLAMKVRYEATSPGRYPANWATIVAALNQATSTVTMTIPFLFWTVRQWMGFDKTCLGFYDDPLLMHEMMDFITDHVIELLSIGIAGLKIDRVILNEDMAYKGAPMVSPAMFRDFMLANYSRLNHFLRQNGVETVLVDCDGNPSELVPLWIEAGMDGFSPVEIAAGTDPVALKKTYGADLAMLGGIDKRVLARDRKSIFEEVVPKVSFLIKEGRYIPHVDHATPPDVPLTNFIYYRELVRRLAEGEDLAGAEPS